VAKYRFVVLSTLVSVFTFLRSLLFMRTLGYGDLGQVAMVQTLAIAVGFLQGGLINGAYIQYAAHEPELNRRIVQTLSTGVLILIPIGILTIVFVYLLGFSQNIIWNGTLGFGFMAGIATLSFTWMNNSLIADEKLGLSNAINLGAAILSFLTALLSAQFGLYAALLSVLLQPLAATIGALWMEPSLRPQKLGLHRETLSLLLKLGFVPFMSGIALLASYQVERWSIAFALGPDALGHYYIVLIYSAFFGLVPSALLNVHFPRAKRALATQEKSNFTQIMRQHLYELMGYILLAVIVTVLLSDKIVGTLLPAYSSQVDLVYYSLPALLTFTLRDSASLVMYATERMRPIVTAGVATLVVFITLIVLLYYSGYFSLTAVLAAKTVAICPWTIFLFLAQRRELDRLKGIKCGVS
jgi:O-antigen/teichoic acid export membrane protein